MAPESPNQKRKRGQPADASGVGESASGRSSTRRKGVAPVDSDPQHNEQDLEEGARPKKRTRQTGTKTATPLTDARKPKRARTGREDAGVAALVADSGKKASRHKSDERQNAEGEASNPQLRRSKRDRNSGDGTPWWEVSGNSNMSRQSQGEMEPTQPEKKKRGRSSLNEMSVDDVQNRATSKSASGEQFKMARGRPSLQVERTDDATPGRRRGRPSLSTQTPLLNEDVGESRRRRGRPRTSDAVTSSEQSRRRSVRQSPKGPKASNSASKELSSPRRKKQRSSNRNAAEPVAADASGPRTAQQLPKPKYRHLVSRTRHIPRSTISAKWTSLDNGAIAAVAALLVDAERPVLLRLRDSDRRREHARSALSLVSRRLRFKLIKGMPFPPASSMSRSIPAGTKSGYEDDLDFERIVNSIQSLESQLDPLLHSVALLTREKDKEEKALEREYSSLRTLEMNARGETRTWLERVRRSHVLAPDIRKDKEGGTGSEGKLEILPAHDDIPGNIFQDLQGEELVSLSKQIGSHIVSMKGNLKQIDGIAPAITKSRAALQEVLHKHLDSLQYEQLLLG